MDDPYLLLIVFSHLDVRTLFHSCALVCRDWNSTFFTPSSSSSSPSEQSSSSFYDTLNKICYLNTTSQKRLNLKTQTRECFATDDSIYSQFDEIKLNFLDADQQGINSLKMFNQLLKVSSNISNSNSSKGTLKSRRKFVTINRECELIAHHREAKESIKQLYLPTKVPFRIDSSTNTKSLLTTSNSTNSILSDVFCTCYPFIVFANKKVSGGFTVLSLVSGKKMYSSPPPNYSKPPTTSSSSSGTIIIQQMEMKYHAQMQHKYKTKLVEFQQNNQSKECYIYSLYILFKEFTSSHHTPKYTVKRFLLIDHLVGDLNCVEDCTFVLLDTGSAAGNINDRWSRFSLSVGDWDVNTMDGLLFYNSINTCMLCLEDGYKIAFMLQSSSSSPLQHVVDSKKGGYPIVPIRFNNWEEGCRILTTNITNITKPLMKEGVSLVDSTNYSQFSVFELKICYENVGPGFTCKIYCDILHVVVAQKKENNQQQPGQPYSIMWKVLKRKGFDNLFQLDVRKISNPYTTYFHEIRELENSAQFIDQGRQLKVSTSFFDYNYLNGNISYIDDLSETSYWDYIEFITVYNSWRFNDGSESSISNFEESTLRLSIKEYLGKKQQLKIYGNVENYFLIVFTAGAATQQQYSLCVVNNDFIRNNKNHCTTR